MEDIRTCIACNTCMESIFRRGRVECLVNPTLGREHEMALVPAESPKKVMVVGGGPGGLDVAWVAAKRGHEVHLYERRETLGGQLLLGAVTSYKRELLSLIEYQKKQIQKHGVQCHLGCDVTPETVGRVRPDVLVLATGSRPELPPIPGVDRPVVRSVNEVFAQEGVPAAVPSVVIGGGATGCEAALHLSEAGCPVTMVEKLMRIGARIESVTRKMILERLTERGVSLLTGCEVLGIEERGVRVRDREGEEHFVEAEQVVVVTGMRPVNGLHERVRHLGIPVYQIGDCLEPRSAKAAIYEGALIGRKI